VLEAEARTGNFTRLAELRAGWLQLPDAGVRIQHVTEYEAQTLQMLDQPLRLGAIGTAIVDAYPGSLLGHMALASFYDRVGQTADATREHAAVNAIGAALQKSGDGTSANPYAAICHQRCHRLSAFSRPGRAGFDLLRHRGQSPAPQSARQPGSAKPLKTIVFDVTPTFTRLQQVHAGENGKPASLPQLLFEMARHGDSGAQTTAATQLMREELSHQTSAFRLLQQAVTDGNLYARLALAQGYLNAYNGEPEGDQRKELLNRAIEQLEQGVHAGSDIAMLELGRVYISGFAGDAKKPDGVALIQQSVALNQPAAMLVLARLYNDGDGVPKDVQKARALLLQAASMDFADGKLAYAQFQLASTPPTLDDQSRTWLQELAKAEHPNAMLMLAGIQARGIAVPKDVRAAKKLYRAVANNPAKNPELINDVVWTFTVTDEPQLRDAREALKLMDAMMASNQDANRNPAYLDTWAAAYAANGKFPRAIELQEMAVKAAKDQLSDDVVKVMSDHLAAFKRGETVTEKTP